MSSKIKLRSKLGFGDEQVLIPVVDILDELRNCSLVTGAGAIEAPDRTKNNA